MSMKTAIAVPDKVFGEAERYARFVKQSRSAVYGDALAEYLARHAPEAVIAALNRMPREIEQQEDAFVTAACRRALERTPR
jgi:predicted transcriptional regulator